MRGVRISVDYRRTRDEYIRCYYVKLKTNYKNMQVEILLNKMINDLRVRNRIIIGPVILSVIYKLLCYTLGKTSNPRANR